MKKRIILFIFSFQLVLLASCQKPAKEPAASPTNLEVVWNAPFHSDATPDFFWEHVFADQHVVLPNMYDRAMDEKPRGIGVYNRQTGKRHPAWTSDPGGIFSASEKENIQDCKVVGKNKDIILIYSSYDLFAYSLHSGQRIWKLNIPEIGAPKISVKDNYAFICYAPGAGGALSSSSYHLAIVDVYSGEKTDVLQLYTEDGYEFCIHPPSLYVAPEGDILLFFKTTGYHFAAMAGRVHAYCYNMTKKQMLWANKNFSIDNGSSDFQQPPYVIENDKLIVTSLHGIHCLNRHTGELIWQKDGLLNSIAGTPPLYYEGKLYVRYGNPNFNLMCIDAQSGQQLWENTTLNPRPPFIWGTMDIYNDKLYLVRAVGGKPNDLACVDIHTGEALWTDKGSAGGFVGDVLIDQQTGYLYCNTGWSLMCVDLNKTPNEKKDN
jgi:outer membrane protein assembly factor BamB